MAGAASLEESAIVRILVTAFADGAQPTEVLRGRTLSRFMALRTRHGGVLPAEAEACLSMIEARRCLPVIHGVALAAIRIERIPVRIRVAGNAIGIEAKVGAAKVFNADSNAAVVADELWLVTLAALESSMPSLQLVSSFAVIELPRIPFDQHKGPAQMFQVARSAGLIFWLALHRDGVVPTAFLQAGANLAVAFVAFERRLSRGEDVTGGTTERTVPSRVRIGQRAG